MTPSLRVRVWLTLAVAVAAVGLSWFVAGADPSARPQGVSALAVAIFGGCLFGWLASRAEWVDRAAYFAAAGVGLLGYVSLVAFAYGRWAVSTRADLIAEAGGAAVPQPLVDAAISFGSFVAARGETIYAGASSTAGTLLTVGELLLTLVATLGPAYAMLSGLFVQEPAAAAEDEPYVAEYRSEDALDTDTDIDVSGLSGLDLAGK